MNIPEAWHRWCQFEVAAEAAEARLMGQAIYHESHMLLHALPGGRFANVQALPVPAFLAADVDEHGKL